MPKGSELPLANTSLIGDDTDVIVIVNDNGTLRTQRAHWPDVLPRIQQTVDSANQYVDDAQKALSENQKTVSDFVESAQNSLGSVNLLSGSRGTSDKNIVDIGEFEGIPDLLPTNGASQFISVGKFFRNNTTNGGGAGELSEPVQSLLAAMGRTENNALGGAGFYVTEVTAGALTTNENTYRTGHYLLLNASNRLVAAQNAFYCWVRVVSGELSISQTNTFVDGLRIGRPVITDSNWHFIGVGVTTTSGSRFLLPDIYTAPNSVIQFALPTINAGAVGPKIIRSPEVEI